MNDRGTEKSSRYPVQIYRYATNGALVQLAANSGSPFPFDAGAVQTVSSRICCTQCPAGITTCNASCDPRC